MNFHLVILKKNYLDSIINGEKTVESRFMRSKCSPMGKAYPGDIVFLKQSGGRVLAVAKISKVENFEEFNPLVVDLIADKHNSEILGTDEYWQKVKENCSCGFLAWLEDVREIEPQKINKRDMRGWVVLSDNKHFGLLDKYII